MNERECLTNLRLGAEACLSNAKRLLEDAQVLFERNSYLSCFLLSQLSLEELAKGFKLIEKHLRKDGFSREEWDNLTKYRNSHVSKLKYLQKVEDEWTEQVTSGINLSYLQNLRQIVSEIPWANNSVDVYREKISQVYYRWRKESLYVDYNWGKKQWIEPLSHPIIDGILIDEKICLSSIIRAKHLSQVLLHKLQIKNEKQEKKP